MISENIITLELAIKNKEGYLDCHDAWMGEEVRRWVCYQVEGFRFVVILRRGKSTVYGPTVETRNMAANLVPVGRCGSNAYAVRSREDAQTLLDYDDSKHRTAQAAHIPFEQRREIAATEAMIIAEQNAPAGSTDDEIDEIGERAFDDESEGFRG